MRRQVKERFAVSSPSLTLKIEIENDLYDGHDNHYTVPRTLRPALGQLAEKTGDNDAEVPFELSVSANKGKMRNIHIPKTTINSQILQNYSYFTSVHPPIFTSLQVVKSTL